MAGTFAICNMINLSESNYAENRNASPCGPRQLVHRFAPRTRPGLGGKNPLPVDQAFRLSVLKDTDGRLVLNWQIADGYYLYIATI